MDPKSIHVPCGICSCLLLAILLQPEGHILLNACSDVALSLHRLELLAHDMLIEFNVAVGHALSVLFGDFRHNLSGLVHEVMFDEPLAHEFLA